jgi:predicted transcriptional regulator
MKEQILKLRSDGLTYNEICKELGCSKSTVSYHCGVGQKDKNKKRNQDRKKDTVLSKRVENFQYKRGLKDKSEDFQRPRFCKNGNTKLCKRNIAFTWHDVINKFGWHTTCYLTGRSINLNEPKTYHFDHIIPPKKGGSNEFSNLGITTTCANKAKSDMTPQELLDLCKEILEFNGYLVGKHN